MIWFYLGDLTPNLARERPELGEQKNSMQGEVTTNLKVVYTMDHEVMSCKICDWVLNLSWGPLQFYTKGKWSE